MNDRQVAILIETIALAATVQLHSDLYTSPQRHKVDTDAAAANIRNTHDEFQRLIAAAQALDDTGADSMTAADREHILRGIKKAGS